MEFLRGIEVKEAMDIGDKDAQYAGKIGMEAKRLGLIKSPSNDEPWNLFPKDELFEDLGQWVLPNDPKSGILFCRYREFRNSLSTVKRVQEYHVLFINQIGNSKWDEHQVNYNEAMELLNRCLSWKDLANRISG